VRAAAASLGRLPRAVVHLPRAVPRTLRLGPHGRRRLLALALVAVALGAAYTFWFRDSSFVRVQKVTITGLATADGARVRAKLTEAAHHMTTLHVNAGALRMAVADEPTVHSLAVEPDFPHGLRIVVVENRPVALLVGGGRQVMVAPDGTVLDGVKASGSIPTIDVGGLPSGARMPDGPARERVAVAAAAPPQLLARIDTISVEHGRGVVASLKDGPVVIFGRAEALARKWTAAAAVLAQQSSEGATYIDVRMPDRPVAGGLDPLQDPQAEPEGTAPGAAPGSPGVLPAVPPAAATGGNVTPADPTAGAPVTSTESQQTGSADPASAAPVTPSAGATSLPTQGQP
jgi:cell division protein FtsQ